MFKSCLLIFAQRAGKSFICSKLFKFKIIQKLLLAYYMLSFLLGDWTITKNKASLTHTFMTRSG